MRNHRIEKRVKNTKTGAIWYCVVADDGRYYNGIHLVSIHNKKIDALINMTSHPDGWRWLKANGYTYDGLLEMKYRSKRGEEE